MMSNKNMAEILGKILDSKTPEIPKGYSARWSPNRETFLKQLAYYPLLPHSREILIKEYDDLAKLGKVLSTFLHGPTHIKKKRSRRKKNAKIARVNARISLQFCITKPLIMSLSYSSIARRLILVQPLPPGALPTYDKSSV